MKKLSLERLKDLFTWCSMQKDKEGRSLLERARDSLSSATYLKYTTKVEITENEEIHFYCDCPYLLNNPKQQKPCKHVIVKIIVEHADLLMAHSQKWREWLTPWLEKQKKLDEEVERLFRKARELDKPKDDLLKDFENF